MCFFTVNRKSSVPTASEGKTTTTAKVAAQTAAVTNQKTKNETKALVSKAKQADKVVKSGKLPSKTAEKKDAVNQKTPGESSNEDEKSENCKNEPVVVEKDTLSDPSQSLAAAGPASKKVKEEAAEIIVSSISTTLNNQPHTGDHKQKCLPDNSETTDKDSVVKVESAKVDKSTEKKTERKPFPPREELMATSVKDEEASKDASEPVQLGESGSEAAQPEESCADIKEGHVATEVAVPERTDDKDMESQPAASTAETPSTKTGLINTQGIQIIKFEVLRYKCYNMTYMYSIIDRKENCTFILIFFSQQTASATYSADDAPLTVGEVIEKHLDIKQIGQ